MCATGTGKILVYIIFQKVRYHNFAQICISYSRNNNVILNITLTVRISLYNKATFVALIALLQLYFLSSNSV